MNMESSNHHPQRTIELSRVLSKAPIMVMLAFAVTVLTTGCSGDAEAESTTTATATKAPVAAGSEGSTTGGVVAAASAGPVDTQYFTTVLPVGWEVLADDIDRMGLMTLSEKGTGGAQGVYLKFEAGYSGDPKVAIEKVAKKYDGTPAEASTRNNVEWTRTRYTYSGVRQSMNIAAHEGRKVTITVMGNDYDEDPGVKAILDNLHLK